MTEEARQARNAYKRKWNRENRDRLKQYQERYWKRKAQSDAKKPDEKKDGEAQ